MGRTSAPDFRRFLVRAPAARRGVAGRNGGELDYLDEGTLIAAIRAHAALGRASIEVGAQSPINVRFAPKSRLSTWTRNVRMYQGSASNGGLNPDEPTLLGIRRGAIAEYRR
jgi:RecR protein